MVDPLKNIGVVILAAGRGKRMGATVEQPKVLIPLLGRPLLSFLLEGLKGSVVQTTPVVVIAPDLYVIRERIGPVCEYAIQESQLGTGHAVLAAKSKLLKYDHVLVLYGDHPLVKSRTINTLVSQHLSSSAELTMATLRLPNFEDWFALFDGYGRILRNRTGSLAGIVERKDATKLQSDITEINPGYYLFKASWLWSALPQLSRNNAQGEYYLTDLVSLVFQEQRVVRDITIDDPEEALGVNTPEQLAVVERVLQQKLDAQARMHTLPLPL